MEITTLFRSSKVDTCLVCGGRVDVGDDIFWPKHKNSKGVLHKRCHPGYTAPQPTHELLQELAKQLGVSLPTNQPKIIPATHIPSDLPALKDDMQWFEILPHLLKHCWRICIVGPASAGKSHTFQQWTNAKYKITLYRSIGAEQLLGNNTITKQGWIEWVNATVTKAMLEGETLIIEEGDKFGDDFEGLMYGIFDNDPHLALPNGTIVRPKPGFKVGITTNINPIDAFPYPIVDRFDAILKAEYMHPAACDPDATEAEKELVRRMYAAEPKILINIKATPRKNRVYRSLLRAGIPHKMAMKSVYVDSANEIESTIASIEANLKHKAAINK